MNWEIASFWLGMHSRLGLVNAHWLLSKLVTFNNLSEADNLSAYIIDSQPNQQQKIDLQKLLRLYTQMHKRMEGHSTQTFQQHYSSSANLHTLSVCSFDFFKPALAFCIWPCVISGWCVACPIGYLLPECLPSVSGTVSYVVQGCFC